MLRASRKVSGRVLSTITTKPSMPSERISHMKSKRLLAGRAEQVQHQVIIHRDAAKIHRDGRRLLDPLGFGRDLAFGRDHIDLADRADELRLARS